MSLALQVKRKNLPFNVSKQFCRLRHICLSCDMGNFRSLDECYKLPSHPYIWSLLHMCLHQKTEILWIYMWDMTRLMPKKIGWISTLFTIYTNSLLSVCMCMQCSGAKAFLPPPHSLFFFLSYPRGRPSWAETFLKLLLNLIKWHCCYCSFICIYFLKTVIMSLSCFGQSGIW